MPSLESWGGPSVSAARSRALAEREAQKGPFLTAALKSVREIGERAGEIAPGASHRPPAQVIITPSSVTLFKPQWVGKREESLHMAHVASITIDTHMIFSDVQIETTGGRNPLVCYGHTKGDAVKMKAAIEKFQTEYYKKTNN